MVTAAPVRAKPSSTGMRRRIGPPGSQMQVSSAASAASECREFSVFVEGDDDGDREAGSHALREADGSDVDDDRQSREVGCSGQEGRRHAGLLPLPPEKVAQQCFRCRFADPADDLGAVVAR